jgi:hypothetical protein
MLERPELHRYWSSNCQDCAHKHNAHQAQNDEFDAANMKPY